MMERACHCLCGKAHPDDPGICEVFEPVTTRHFDTPLLGPVDVPLCAPCAAAQGIEVPDAQFREQATAFMDRNDRLLRRLADG
jgi:hypothetical protein